MSHFEQVSDRIERVCAALHHLPVQRLEAERDCRLDWILNHMDPTEAETLSKIMADYKWHRRGSLSLEDDLESAAILQEATRRADADPSWQQYHEKFMAEALKQRGHHR
jgi:hypothetical protein